MEVDSPAPDGGSEQQPTEQEADEYKRFLEEQETKEKAAELAMMEEAKKELAAKERDRAYNSALTVMDDTIVRAQNFHFKMSELSENYTAERLAIDKQPALMSGGSLRDYQLEGFQWLVRKFFMGESGIIADEMGLGKTVQVIAFVAWLWQQFGGAPVLIIGPLSTVGNWCDEIKRFTPLIPVCRYRGSIPEREELRRKHIPPEAYRTHAVKDMPVFVTSYNFAMNDAPHLSGVHWRVLCVDEGHRIKNENSAFREILKQYTRFEIPGHFAQTKLLLTGTPVQNDLIELWSLCNFVMPQVFRTKEEFKLIYKFVGIGTAAGASFIKEQEQKNQIISKLHVLLERYMLRRVKDQVHLSLPPKVEALVYTPLTKEQIRMLKAINDGRLQEEVNSMGWRPANDLDSDVYRHFSSMNTQMQLRKACVHPYFIAEPPVVRGTTDARIVTSCGKMAVLDKMLRRLRQDGHKVLIFTQFVTVIDILADYLNWVGSDVIGEYRFLHGSVPADERDQAIRDFNNDPDNKIFVFLLATRAGGLGINLTAADTVIFYDSDWNPKSDAQAQDRAHRIGQTRPVVVYRLITEGASIERRMLRTAAGKSSLGRMVLQEGRHRFNDLAEDGLTPGSQRLSDDDEETKITESDGHSRYGLVNEKLLKYWLRDDVSDRPLLTGGITDEELYTILRRDRALQAGKRVAETVEAELITELAADSRAETDHSAPSHGTPSTVRGHEVGKCGNHLAVPPTAPAAQTVLEHAELEQSHWEQIANAAPYTPSKAAGYEFVYHEASRGILPMPTAQPKASLDSVALAEPSGPPATDKRRRGSLDSADALLREVHVNTPEKRRRASPKKKASSDESPPTIRVTRSAATPGAARARG